jgi:hypothetical protein
MVRETARLKEFRLTFSLTLESKGAILRALLGAKVCPLVIRSAFPGHGASPYSCHPTRCRIRRDVTAADFQRIPATPYAPLVGASCPKDDLPEP